MKNLFILAAALAAAGLVACTPSVCDRSASPDTNKKLVGCEKPLGDPATCQARAKGCSGDVTLAAAQTTYGDPDGGAQEKRSYWVAGYASDGKLVIGQVATADAGPTGGCQNLFDCNIDQVCDVTPDASIRTCQTQTYTTN